MRSTIYFFAAKPIRSYVVFVFLLQELLGLFEFFLMPVEVPLVEFLDCLLIVDSKLREDPGLIDLFVVEGYKVDYVRGLIPPGHVLYEGRKVHQP